MRELSREEPVAGNGLLHRRIFLRGRAAFAAAATGYTPSDAAFAQPLADDSWSGTCGQIVPQYGIPSAFEKSRRHRDDQDDRQLLAVCHDAVRLHRPPCRASSPGTLSGDEVYAVTASILALNRIVSDNVVMTAETLPKVRMPNRNRFVVRFPERMP